MLASTDTAARLIWAQSPNRSDLGIAPVAQYTDKESVCAFFQTSSFLNGCIVKPSNTTGTS
jgi:hypothetical protein